MMEYWNIEKNNCLAHHSIIPPTLTVRLSSRPKPSPSRGEGREGVILYYCFAKSLNFGRHI